ncbi:MAG: hypothetical protein GYB67_09305 [Chloroflexi bacterium]|nr:hypothetical protein [Chloroflexota bacterium]
MQFNQNTVNITQARQRDLLRQAEQARHKQCLWRATHPSSRESGRYLRLIERAAALFL